MKSIEVKYFANLRDLAGCESEIVQGVFNTYADLYHFLDKKYNFGMDLSLIQLAVNDEFADINNAVTENVKVVFIPPVAGG